VLSGRLDLVKDETAKRVIDASRALGHTERRSPRSAHAAHRQHRGRPARVLEPRPRGRDRRHRAAGAERGLSVVIDAIRPDKPADFARLVSENRVDGLLFSAASDRSFALDVLEATAVPYVLVNRSVPQATASVVLDEEAGVEAASGAWSRPGTRGSPTSRARRASTPPGGGRPGT
jgi:DNA-binding LacI/PurR family transcriptional regulator